MIAVSLSAPTMVTRIKALYFKIAVPRLPKLAHSLIYISTAIGGVIATIGLPPILVHFIGPTMVVIFGLFSFTGSLLALVAVLPGVIWLERVGVILLTTAVVMYIIMLMYSAVITVALWLVVPLAVMLIEHLIDIRP